MSYTSIPDPYPGRCKNLRPVRHSDGHIENLRCLEYEDEDHVCNFPEAPVVTETHNIFQTSDLPEPKPWVRPDNVTEVK